MKTLKIKFCVFMAGAFYRLILLRSRLRGYRPGQIDLWSYAGYWSHLARSIETGPPKSPVELTLHLSLQQSLEAPVRSEYDQYLDRKLAAAKRPVLSLTLDKQYE